MLYRPESPTATHDPVVIRTEPRPIAGRWLAHKGLTPTERALLAADLAAGRAVLVKPTLHQAIALTGASPSYANAARKLDVGERRAVKHGWRPLIPQGGQRALPKPTPTLADLWDRATPEEQEAVVRPRVAAVWDVIERAIT